MQFPGAMPRIFLLATAAAALLAACDRPLDFTQPAAPANPTAVLGGYGSGPRSAASAPLTDGRGQAIPLPRLPRNTTAQLARLGPDGALAAWVQDDHVVAASYAPGTGWTAPQPLERIYGQSSDPQLASDGRGTAMAIWRHTVGSIESLRYSRFEQATGWSPPDVMPGALPRPRPPGIDAARQAAPQLRMDADGNAWAEWPSGFDDGELQSARYVVGQGWTRAISEPMTASGAAR